MKELQDPRIAELVVERSQVVVCEHLGIERLKMRADIRRDDFSDNIAMRLVAYLAANTVHREVEASERVPCSWWDGFKLAWFPRWALRRWPAKERTVEREVKFVHMCPHLPAFGGDASVHAVWLSPPNALSRWGRR